MKNRIVALDLIKIIACILVIADHTSIYILRLSENSPFNVLFFSILYMVSKIAVPLFVMVTGSLLLSRQDSYSKMLKRVWKVFVPLFGLSLLIYIARNGLGSVGSFIPSFLQERTITPFWYLYMLIGLYLVSPFINKMVKNFTELDHRIFILLILIIPATAMLLSKVFGFTLYKEFFTAFIPIVVGYFVSGYYFSNWALSKKQRMILLGITIVTLGISSSATFYGTFAKGEADYFLNNIYFINTVIASIGVFNLVRHSTLLTTLSDRDSGLIVKTAELTFGIYLIHAFLFPVIAESGISKTIFTFSPIVGIVVLDLAVFTLSAVLILILKRIPLIKDYL